MPLVMTEWMGGPSKCYKHYYSWKLLVREKLVSNLLQRPLILSLRHHGSGDTSSDAAVSATRTGPRAAIVRARLLRQRSCRRGSFMSARAPTKFAY